MNSTSSACVTRRLRTALQLHTELSSSQTYRRPDQSSHVFAQLARMYDGMDRVWSPRQ